MKTFNLHGDEWDGGEKRTGWRMKEVSVRERVGAELIGGSFGTRNAAGERLFLSRPGPSVGYWDAED